MAIYRLVCALERQRLVPVLTRCGLPLPVYLLADEKQSRCRAEKVYLPTIVSGRLIWHVGSCEEKSTRAFARFYGAYRQAAMPHDPTYEVRGMLTDGFASARHGLRRLFSKARLGSCWLPAVRKLPGKLTAISSEVRHQRSDQCVTLLCTSGERKSLRVVAIGQKLRHFVGKVSRQAGQANGARVRQWVQHKKAGWYAVLDDPQMPVCSTVLDQAHNAMDRKLFMMKGFHHPAGQQQAFLRRFLSI